MDWIMLLEAIGVGWAVGALLLFVLLVKGLKGRPVPLGFVFTALIWPFWLILYALADKTTTDDI